MSVSFTGLIFFPLCMLLIEATYFKSCDIFSITPKAVRIKDCDAYNDPCVFKENAVLSTEMDIIIRKFRKKTNFESKKNFFSILFSFIARSVKQLNSTVWIFLKDRRFGWHFLPINACKSLKNSNCPLNKGQLVTMKSDIKFERSWISKCFNDTILKTSLDISITDDSQNLSICGSVPINMITKKPKDFNQSC